MTGSTTTPTDGGRTNSSLYLGFLVSCGVMGVASGFFPPLSVFALLVLVIALASTTRLRSSRKRLLVGLLAGATCVALLGLYRFALGDALRGIIEARGRETSKRTVSLLREFHFAQDAMRRYAFIDPDGDGIGSAGLLGELSGAWGARGGNELSIPPLAPRNTPQVVTRSGAALERDGYLFLICLPRKGSGLTALPTDPIDDELAERRWVAYAWQADETSDVRPAFFIDEHERILESANRASHQSPRLAGPGGAPDCDDFEKSSSEWLPWQGKQPKVDLAGDRTNTASP